MHTYALTHVSDEALLSGLSALVATDRLTTASLLAHIAEVDARKLFLPAACSSMHSYCLRVLHFSEDAAYKRIQAARAARRHPQIFDLIAQGRIHLTAVVRLAPHLTNGNVDEVLAAAEHRTKEEIEILVARLAPKSDLRPELTRDTPPSEPTPAGATDLLQLVPEPVAPREDSPPSRVKPLAPERFGLQVTISQETRDKLDRAQALMRHRNPSGDLAQVIDRALDALLVTLEREKFGATSRPRAKRARSEDANPRYVTHDVRRAVHDRDGEQCTFVSKDGVRCTERGFLELDHRTPVALGGKPTIDATRILCRAHNQYEAERVLGADFMREKRRAARASRAKRTTRVSTPADSSVSKPRGAETVTASIESNAGSAQVGSSPSGPFDTDVAHALRTMGFRADETRYAMAATAQQPAKTLEERLRAALAALYRSRCGDGPFDSQAPMGMFIACAAPMYRSPRALLTMCADASARWA